MFVGDRVSAWGPKSAKLRLLTRSHCLQIESHVQSAGWGWVKCSLGISDFLEEISSFSYSIVFIYALIPEKGFLMSPCYSLEFGIRVGISFLFSLLFISLGE